MTDRELCFKCASDPGTIANMQSIVIPALLKEIEDAKMVIRALPRDKEIVTTWRNIMVDDIKAIRAFYNRFPTLQRVELRADLKAPELPRERKHFVLRGPEADKLLRIIRLSREIKEYSDILSGLNHITDNEAVERAVKRILEFHKELKKL